MTLFPTTEVIPLRVDADAVARVGDTRITLETVIGAFADGATAEEIVQQYPSLQLPDVYYVIGYYLRGPAELQAYLRRRESDANRIRERNESQFDPQGIRDRLLARRKDGN